MGVIKLIKQQHIKILPAGFYFKFHSVYHPDILYYFGETTTA
jgi:hypothetical protein